MRERTVLIVKRRGHCLPMKGKRGGGGRSQLPFQKVRRGVRVWAIERQKKDLLSSRERGL